nr:unnamed protein product [Callosobruchus analis]
MDEGSSSSSSEDDNVIIRRPRIFKDRISYNMMQETYEYNERFRLSFAQFTFLLEHIEARLEHPTRRNKALTSHQQLEIALHWLGTGAQFHSISDMHGISKATVCRVVHKVIDAIEETLVNELVCWPNDCGTIVNGFSNLAGMPLVCGALDGTLIKMDAPHDFEPAFVDRHGDHSINAMVVCGPNLQFFYVYADWPGSATDARVLRNSGLFRRMEEGWRPYPGGFLLGDSIYPLKSWLIPPIVGDVNRPEQRRFARAHKKTRRTVECAIGLMKEKFPCLNYLRLQPVFVCKVIKCCVALCNLSRFHDELIELNSDGEDVDPRGNANDVDYGGPDQRGQDKLNFLYRHFEN